MVLILNIPTNFLNDKLAYHYPKDKMISVFTTYNLEDYFLDSIVYHGSGEELNNIKTRFTKVILRDIGASRNDSDFLILARKLIVGEKLISQRKVELRFGAASLFSYKMKIWKLMIISFVCRYMVETLRKNFKIYSI